MHVDFLLCYLVKYPLICVCENKDVDLIVQNRFKININMIMCVSVDVDGLR